MNKIDKILEPIPDEKAIKIIPKYINQYDRPYFLFVRAKKQYETNEISLLLFIL